jgi:hypothetical protein
MMIYSKKQAEEFVTFYKRAQRECVRKNRNKNSLHEKLMISNMLKWLKTNYLKYIYMLQIVEYFNRFPSSKMYQPQDMLIPPMPRTPCKKKRRYSVHRRVPSRIVAGKIQRT